MTNFLQILSSFLLLISSCICKVSGFPVQISDYPNCWSYTGPKFIRTQGYNAMHESCHSHREFILSSSCYPVDDRLETSLRFTNCRGNCSYKVITYSGSNCHGNNKIPNGTFLVSESRDKIVNLNERKSICSFGIKWTQSRGRVTFNQLRNINLDRRCVNMCGRQGNVQAFYPLEASVEGLEPGNHLTLFSATGCSRRSLIHDRNGNSVFVGNENLPDFTRIMEAVRAFKVVRV